MGYRAGRILHVVVMIWISLLFLGAWLAMVHAVMDSAGNASVWRKFGIGPVGTPDLWYRIAKCAIGLALLYFGWRTPNGRVRYLLALVVALSLLSGLYRLGAGTAFPTSLIYWGIALDGLIFGLASWWALRAPPLAQPPLGGVGSTLIGLAAALLPVQYLLLHADSGAGPNGISGVLLAALSWLLLSAGLAPWRGGRDDTESASGTLEPLE